MVVQDVGIGRGVFSAFEFGILEIEVGLCL